MVFSNRLGEITTKISDFEKKKMAIVKALVFYIRINIISVINLRSMLIKKCVNISSIYYNEK